MAELVRTPEYHIELPNEPQHAMIIEGRNDRGGMQRVWRFRGLWWNDQYNTHYDWSEIVASAIVHRYQLYVCDA